MSRTPGRAPEVDAGQARRHLTRQAGLWDLRSVDHVSMPGHMVKWIVQAGVALWLMACGVAAPVSGGPGSGGSPTAATGGTGSGGTTPGTGGEGGDVPAGSSGGDQDAGAVPDAAASTSTGGSTGVSVDARSADEGTAQNAAAQLCVDTINMYRATLGLAPYARWTPEQEACVSAEALSDSQANKAHGAFGMCTENAQDECPGWGGSLDSIVTGCLKQMWAEGPGTDFATHGHYINMSSTKYTRVACGFAAAANGKTWAAQDFK